MKFQKTMFTKHTCAVLFGTSLLPLGLGLYLLSPWLVDLIIDSQLVISPSSPAYEAWRKFPEPLALDFYFFNWTNWRDVHNLSTKPHFEECGPYRFIETKEKVNMTWNDNGTVTYRQLRYWKFDEGNSRGKLHDKIFTINAITASAAYQATNWSYLVKKGMSFGLQAMSPQVHVERTIDELLFSGYEDPFVNIANTFPFLAAAKLPKMDKFGWFVGRNGSYTFDGTFNMGTGQNGDMGVIYQWNYLNQTNFYDGKCGSVHGSAGELYLAKPQKTSIGFFSTDMCRHVQLDYESEVLIKGIKGYKYSAQEGLLDNGDKIAGNKCYCNGKCVPKGAMDISRCRYGTPGFVSLPHFYGADPYYLSLLDGLHPQKERHQLQITLEPRTGLPLSVNARLQLNLFLQPVSSITLFEKVPTVYFPVLWFEQGAHIPDKFVTLLRVVLLLPSIVNGVAIALMTVGLIVLLFFMYRPVFDIFHKRVYFSKFISRDEVPLQVKSEKNTTYILVQQSERPPK